MKIQPGGTFCLCKLGQISLNQFGGGDIVLDGKYLYEIIKEHFPRGADFAGELLLTIRSKETELEISNTLTDDEDE